MKSVDAGELVRITEMGQKKRGVATRGLSEFNMSSFRQF